MAWLAPIGTRACSPNADSQEPNWQLARASWWSGFCLAAARAATARVVRPLGLELLDLQLARVAAVTVVITHDDFPELVMYEGEPFVRDISLGPLAYRQVRPVHAIRS
jgi:hypothetical protein